MYTDIVLSKLKNLIQDLENSEKRLKVKLLELDTIRRSLKSMDDEALRVVCDKLKQQQEGLNRDINKIKLLRTALLKIISLYEKCEEQILKTEATPIWKFGGFIPINIISYVKPIQLLDLKFTFQPVKGGEE